jgi:hypothetical protein
MVPSKTNSNSACRTATRANRYNTLPISAHPGIFWAVLVPPHRFWCLGKSLTLGGGVQVRECLGRHSSATAGLARRCSDIFVIVPFVAWLADRTLGARPDPVTLWSVNGASACCIIGFSRECGLYRVVTDGGGGPIRFSPRPIEDGSLAPHCTFKTSATTRPH